MEPYLWRAAEGVRHQAPGSEIRTAQVDAHHSLPADMKQVRPIAPPGQPIDEVPARQQHRGPRFLDHVIESRGRIGGVGAACGLLLEEVVDAEASRRNSVDVAFQPASSARSSPEIRPACSRPASFALDSMPRPSASCAPVRRDAPSSLSVFSRVREP
jgi:hypothetical protein